MLVGQSQWSLGVSCMYAVQVSWNGLSCACTEPELQHTVAQARLCHGVRLLSRSLEGGSEKDVGGPCRTRHSLLHIALHARLCPKGGPFCAGAREEDQGRMAQALHHDRRRTAGWNLSIAKRGLQESRKGGCLRGPAATLSISMWQEGSVLPGKPASLTAIILQARAAWLAMAVRLDIQPSGRLSPQTFSNRHPGSASRRHWN